MNNQSYYRIADARGCDIAVADKYLVVNCTGICVMPEPFTTWNERGRHDYYLMYLYNGGLDMSIGGSVHAMQAGSLVIIPPEHPYRYTKRDTDSVIYYWAHFTGFSAKALLDGCSLETCKYYAAGVHADVAECFRHMFHSFIFRDDCFEAAAAAQLAEICVLLRRKTGAPPSMIETAAAGKIQASLDFIYNHYSSRITVASLAEIEHLSISRYCALFRRSTGISPQAFLIGLRIYMAVELMKKTDLSIKQVARNVGYDDPLYFSRLFKARMGVSPRKYLAGYMV